MHRKGVEDKTNIRFYRAPLIPMEPYVINGKRYFLRGEDIYDEFNNVVGNINKVFEIDGIRYNSYGAAFLMTWPKMENFFVWIKNKIIGSKNVKKAEQKEREIQQLIEEHRKQMQKFESELREKNKIIAEKNAILERELDMAQDIQQGIIPKNVPEWNGISFAMKYRPMEKVSGDFYDIYTKKGFLFLLMADVSGHGIPAALITMAAKQSFANAVMQTNSPKEIFIRMNKEMLERVQTSDYLTAFLAVIDEKYNVVYSNASHQYAIIHRYKKNKLEYLDTEGLFIGAMEESNDSYEESSTKLEPGDRLILYTDGIVEHKNPEGEEFGDDRFAKIIKAHKDKPIEELVENVFSELMKFIDTAPIRDDISIMVAELTPKWTEFALIVKKANEHFDNNDYDKGIELLEKAYNLIPSYYAVLPQLANAMIKKERYDDAIKYLKTYISHNPDDENALYLISRAYRRTKQYHKAIEYAMRALAINPNHKKALTVLGFSHYYLNQYKEALNYFKKAYLLDDSNEKLAFLIKEMESKINE